MRYDFIIGIDPGYATLGLAIIDLRNGRPQFVHMSSALTVKTVKAPTSKEKKQLKIKFPIEEFQEREETFQRINLLADYVRGAIRHVCNPIFKLNALIVIEEWTASPNARYVKTIYYRGAADAAVRQVVNMYGAQTLTVDNIWVNQFSNVQGKKTIDKDNPTPMEILLCIQMLCPWLNGFDVQQWLEHRGTAHTLNGSRQQKGVPEKAKLHYADAAVMATMGVLAIDPDLAGQRPPNQMEKLSYLWERLREVQDHDLRQRSGN